MAGAAAEFNGDIGELRQNIRSGQLTSTTAGLAPDRVQGNMVILPAEYAGEFKRFCELNWQSCPLLTVSKPGETDLPEVGRNLDVRYDLPGYRIYRDSKFEREVSDIADVWRADLVTFIIGCSFTFEKALAMSGISLRHIETGSNVPMYITNRNNVPYGRFGGKMVVSMRPMLSKDADRAAGITVRFADMHGAPVHRGDPAALGIRDLNAVDYGEPAQLRDGEEPVFWACGVTSQLAVQMAGLPFFIAHAPGKMLITDRPHPFVVSN